MRCDLSIWIPAMLTRMDYSLLTYVLVSSELKQVFLEQLYMEFKWSVHITVYQWRYYKIAHTNQIQKIW